MNYIGKRFGHYQILKLLGHGGFADVYLGEHIDFKAQVAVKVLRTHLEQEDRERFRQEVLLITNLVHPNIIRVLDFDVEHTTPYLVMEYAPSGSVRRQYPKGSQLSPETFIPYVKQVAAALQYAHDRKLIHRDVKPENMLLSGNGQVKLSDFGIALIAQSTLSQETESEVVGTMMYMAPEQIQGKARPASDQYSLGVVVYEWLTGNKPFRGSYMEIIGQHLSAPPPPVDEQALGISHAFIEVLWKALAKDYHERFARVQDFADALEEAYHSGETTVVRRKEIESEVPPPPFPTSPPPVAITTPTVTPDTRQPRPWQQEKLLVSAPLTGTTSPTAITTGARSVETPRLDRTRMVRPALKKATGCARKAVIALIVIPLLVCGLGFAGYGYLANRNPTSQATAMASDFMSALSQQNYDRAFNDLGSRSFFGGTSRDGFINQGRNEDRCYGVITHYEETSTSTPNGTQVHNYLVSRTKIAKPYHLHVTVSRDFFGNWHISDYNSDANVGQPPCSGS